MIFVVGEGVWEVEEVERHFSIRLMGVGGN